MNRRRLEANEASMADFRRARNGRTVLAAVLRVQASLLLTDDIRR